MIAAPLFRRERYALANCELRPLEAADALVIAEVLSRMPPWRTLGYYAEHLGRFLLHDDPGFFRYAIMAHNDKIGAVCVRQPWLKGSYLELLGIFEPFQGMGVGREVIAWMERCTRPAAKNLWALVSDFNSNARAFYRKMGFVEAASLPGLVKPGRAEILIRKILD